MRTRVCAALAALSIILAPGVIRADDRPRNRHNMAGGPYCGILCVYAAMKTEGLSVRFEDLVDHRYVGSERGSSLAELETAARDSGAHATAVEGLTAASLRAADHPIILHVRRPGKGTVFNHWVLFLGCEGNSARVLDPPHEVELVPIPELLALWDGTGMFVSGSPVPPVDVGWSAWGEALLPIVLVFGLVGIGRYTTSGRRGGYGVAGFAGRVVLLALGAAIFGVGWHLAHPDGLLANRTAVAHVAVRYFASEVPAIDATELEGMLGRPGATVIDARYPEDYEAGHIPGAVNLPVFASLTLRREVVGQIPADHTVVVYCQSTGCTWSHTIASDLALRGFKRVVVYPGGWEEWDERTRTGRAR